MQNFQIIAMTNLRLFFILAAMLLACATSPAAVEGRIVSTVEMSPSEQMTYIYFDHAGMMWIGTNSGLKSYDGYTMRTFRSDVITPGVFPNNSVVSITEDNENNLWVGTRNGIVKMNRCTGLFSTYHLQGELRKIIYTMYTAADGTVFVGTDAGLSCYDPKADRFVSYGVDLPMTVVEPAGNKYTMTGNYSVKSITESRDGRYLYIGTWNYGVLRMQRGTKTFHRYPDFEGDTRAFALHVDKYGRLYIGVWNGNIYRMDNPKDFRRPMLKQMGLSNTRRDPIYNIIGDTQSNTVWACMRNDIGVLDLDNDEAGFNLIKKQDDGSVQPQMFNNLIAADRRGNIWVQKRFRKIMLVSMKRPLFNMMFTDVANKPYPYSSIYTIFTDDGNTFWLGLMPIGIARYDCATGQTQFNRQIPELSQLPENVINTSIASIVKRRNGELWLANRSYGIITLRRGEKAKIIDSKVCKALPEDYVNALAEHSDGSMWVGTRSGLLVIDVRGNAMRLEMKDENHDYSNCDIRHFTEDKTGAMWIATENEGIIRVSRNNAGKGRQGKYAFKHYSPAEKNFAVDDATACLEDSHGRIWAISTSGGLFLFDSKNDKFNYVNHDYHIYAPNIYAINEDRRGNLWLTTENALMRLSLNGETLEATMFSEEDGIAELLFPPNSTMRYGENLYFGCGDALLAFNLEQANSRKPTS